MDTNEKYFQDTNDENNNEIFVDVVWNVEVKALEHMMQRQQKNIRYIKQTAQRSIISNKQVTTTATKNQRIRMTLNTIQMTRLSHCLMMKKKQKIEVLKKSARTSLL